MKKSLALFLALAMFFVLAACSPTAAPPASSPPASSPAPSQSVAPSPEPAKPIQVGIALANADEFTAKLEQQYKQYAAEYNIEVNLVNANSDVSTQIANVEALIARKPDVIVLRCVDAETGDTLVKMVKNAGIYCIVDETQPATNRDYDVNIMGDQKIHGELIGAWLQAYLDKNSGEKLNMLYINGGTSDNIRKRMTGITNTVKSDRFAQIGDELGSWDATKAQEITEAYLTAHPEMNLICAANDTMAAGAVSALEAAGMLDKVMVFGVDGSEIGHEYIKSGKMTGTTLNDTSIQVKLIYECANTLVDGGSIAYSDAENKKLDPAAYVLLTAENIGEMGIY